MMVDQAIAEVVTTPPNIDHALMRSLFTLFIHDQKYPQTQAFLFQDSILLKVKKGSESSYLKINFSFDLIFDLLRTGAKRDVSTDPLGFRFQREEDKPLVIESPQPGKHLLPWRDFLENKLNQRGFHQIFKPIKKIGKGNFASVYLVYKHQDGHKYAVKAFSKEATYAEERGKDSLVNEIQVMRKFNHKNLMRLFGIYESDNSIYISVELLEGGQLYDKIKNRHKFTSLEIKMIMKGILEGLEVMHSHGIMHRDLKPENILLRNDSDYDCVIADFGLAQAWDKNDYLFVRCGTPGYVAPEVVNLKDLKAKYNPICDLFSLGVIFHLLALRKPPFPGKEYNQVLSQNRICNINFEAPQYLSLPKIWLDLMKRLLEKDPTKRITATQALSHEFFSKDNMFAEFNKERNSLRESTDMSSECQSPLMMSKNKERKKPGLLRNDSCLKFKMKENVLTGRTDRDSETVDQVDSPGMKKLAGNGKMGVESRFKKMAQH